jgi:transcriptional regulator with XRE-family HTH domain
VAGYNEISKLTNDGLEPGGRLKEIRTRLGITTREVALFSKTIADAEGNNEFLVSSPWLTQIENDKSALPSIYKLFTLASIYGLSYSQVLGLYGVDLRKVSAFHSQFPIARTHTAEFDPKEAPQSFEIPIRFDAGLNLGHTNLLTRMIETWGSVPMQFIQRFDLRRRLYGFVGFKDYTLYPLLRPGTFVEIDPDINDSKDLKKLRQKPTRTEFDRPIYFVDLRSEYACAWCELEEDRLLLLAHPLSPVKTRVVAYPVDGEIIGQVTGVAMRIAVSMGDSNDEISKAQLRS